MVLVSSSQHEFHYQRVQYYTRVALDDSHVIPRHGCLNSLLHLAKKELGHLDSILPAFLFGDKMKGKKRVHPDDSPPSSPKKLKLESDIRECPVFRHTFELLPSYQGEANPDQELARTISNIEGLLERTSPVDVVTLGKVHLEEAFVTEYRRGLKPIQRPCGVALAISEEDLPGTVSRVLFTLPHITDGQDPDDYDFGEKERDLLKACVVLHSAGKLSLDCKLRISRKDSSPKFKLGVEVSGSIIFPAILEALEGKPHSEAQRRVLTHIYSGHNPRDPVEADISLFYSSIHPAEVPLLPGQEELAQPKPLLPTLLPFQRRSTLKLLNFENKVFDVSGQLSDAPAESPRSLLWSLFPSIEDDDVEELLFFNRITGELRDSAPPAEKKLIGALLAEEMGLGKTLECLALILLNPSPQRSPNTARWDSAVELSIREIKTTLIVTPASLASQWVDEIARHAPSLKVLVYEGWTKMKDIMHSKDKKDKNLLSIKSNKKRWTKDREEISESDLDSPAPEDPFKGWPAFVNDYDIVITTFQNLQSDLSVARAPISRPRRAVALDLYDPIHRPRSPLVAVEWARVIMDEVQLAGGGKTAEMMSLIPRVSSLAVSGTPAKANVSDLVHVLRFLREDPQITLTKNWKRLIKPGFSDIFSTIFSRISIRTLKSQVKHELTIPNQNRYVVGIAMGRVERHIYDETFKQALHELGVDARGVAAYPGWELDVGLLRTWLRKLRAVATHPQVGQLDARDRILAGGGNLRSIGDVLDGMQENCWRAMMDARKSKILSEVKLAQLIQQNPNRGRRYQDALEGLLACSEAIKEGMQTCRDRLVLLRKKGERIIAEAEERKTKKLSLLPDDDDADKEAPSEDEQSDDEDISLSGDSDEMKMPKTPAGDEHRTRVRALHSRIRELQVVQHKIEFLLGDVYHVLGRSEAEDSAYAKADALRKELLKATERGAIQAMERLDEQSKAKSYDPEYEMHIAPCGDPGLKTTLLLEEIAGIFEKMAQQKDLLLKWRTTMIDMLTRKLSESNETGGEADGQEYARALDTQGEVEQYLQAYASLIADRKEILVAERTTLAAHESKVKKLRRTRAALKAAAAAASAAVDGDDDALALLMGQQRVEENEDLRNELTKMRESIRTGKKSRASVMVDLNAVANAIQDEKHPERIIATREANHLRRVIKTQSDAMERLETELAQFRKAFNERLLYFKQLQELSDSVAAIEIDRPIGEEIGECELDVEVHEKEWTSQKGKLGYLASLADHRDEEDDQCIICTDSYEHGWIFECAHRCCESCLKLYLKKHKQCPICRKDIDLQNAQRVTNVRHEDKAADLTRLPPQPKALEYNRMTPELLAEIQKVETNGSYGSKIQSIVRHLVWLQENRPGSKSIVFSAWADTLSIMEHALLTNGVPCVRVESKKGKQNAATRFKKDASILVFLLHGERENAGLNLIEATRVFCIEPVVNHAFETQAIARIDRMGQQCTTEVLCYYSEDTVERRILDLGVRQGVSLYTKAHASGTLLNVAQSDNQAQIQKIDSNKGKKGKGDFVHSADDMLAILFPHLYEDEEMDAVAEEVDEEARMEVDAEFARNLRAAAAATRRDADRLLGEGVAGPSGPSVRLD